MTISIPEDLHHRMQRADGVVWSHVAARAFQAQLDELAKQKEIETMKDVIERLRAENNSQHDEIRARGREIGVEWAKKKALPAELRRLENEGENFHNDNGELLANGYTWLGLLVSMFIDPEEDMTPSDHNDFAERTLGSHEDMSDDEQIALGQGFIEGALSIWKQVKPHI